jgi:hypothetical protein
MDLLLEKLFFAIFLLSILVLFDLLFKFKRPFLLKYNLAIITISVGFASYMHSLDLYTNKYAFYIILCKAFVSSSFLNVFSILYFPNFRKWVTLITFSLISLTIYSFYYNDMEGDADPGFVRQFEDYFVKYLDKKSSKYWYNDQGSEGEFHVNRNTIDLELNLKDEEFRSSGFHKEIKL